LANCSMNSPPKNAAIIYAILVTQHDRILL
jgi:hypothetical protein